MVRTRRRGVWSLAVLATAAGLVVAEKPAEAQLPAVEPVTWAHAAVARAAPPNPVNIARGRPRESTGVVAYRQRRAPFEPLAPVAPIAWHAHDAPRPRSLPLLYAAFGVLQALDLHSTLRAVDAGHREGNRVLAPLLDRPAAALALKGAATAATIFLAERLWRRHRPAAVLMMIALNVAYGAVVAHNYRQAAR